MTEVLLVKTSSLGDVVHNLPVVSDLVATYPDLAISWIVEESLSDIPGMHPNVQEVIPVAIRRWRKNLFDSNTFLEIRTFRQQLRQREYDYIVDTQGLLKSAVVARWAIGPCHGGGWSTAREPSASLFYNRRYQIKKNQHAVQRNRELVAKIMGYSIDTLPINYGIKSKGTATGIDGRYIVCLHGTAQKRKLWRADDWVALGRTLISSGITTVFPWGTQVEHNRAQELSSQIPGSVVLDRLNVNELASILNNSIGVAGIDTGLTHLSVALGKPTIGIYVDTDPALTGLYPGELTKATNLGGIGATVTSFDVLDTLNKMGVLD